MASHCWFKLGGYKRTGNRIHISYSYIICPVAPRLEGPHHLKKIFVYRHGGGGGGAANIRNEGPLNPALGTAKSKIIMLILFLTVYFYVDLKLTIYNDGKCAMFSMPRRICSSVLYDMTSFTKNIARLQTIWLVYGHIARVVRCFGLLPGNNRGCLPTVSNGFNFLMTAFELRLLCIWNQKPPFRRCKNYSWIILA